MLVERKFKIKKYIWNDKKKAKKKGMKVDIRTKRMKEI